MAIRRAMIWLLCLMVTSVAFSQGLPAPRKGRDKGALPKRELAKYAKLSRDPVSPRLVGNSQVVINTDLSDRDARILLDDLSALVKRLATYYRNQPKRPVQCYVVKDFNRWPEGKFSIKLQEAMIKNKAVASRLIGASEIRNAGKRVYAMHDRLAIRRAMVTAYCNQQFGDCGHEWYRTGMAEVGKHWDRSVNTISLDAETLQRLRTHDPIWIREDWGLSHALTPSSKILEVRFSDHRWLLCFMLINNSNYRRKFQELGVDLISKRPGAEFKTTFSDKMGDKMNLEYKLLLANVANGVQPELCRWNWRHRFKEVPESGMEKMEVKARAAWQPGVLVSKSVRYQFAAKGSWQIDRGGTELSANGNDKGVGKLWGVVLHEGYELGEPFEIGNSHVMQFPNDGRLYLCCKESWSDLADNSGKLTVYIRRAIDSGTARRRRRKQLQTDDSPASSKILQKDGLP